MMIEWRQGVWGVLSIFLLTGCATQRMETVGVRAHGFVLAKSQKPFTPWGHNYPADEWAAEGEAGWRRMARDFDDFRASGANVARVHLQVPHFLEGPNKPNALALAELARLLKLAEAKRVYLDITGLASYNVKHRAAWYDALPDRERWAAQVCFWEAVSATCAQSPAVFCYDLINEPLAAGNRTNGWYAGRMGDYEFLQRLSLDQEKRPGEEIAKEWTHLMVSAIRQHDAKHLITIGMLPVYGPSPKVVGRELDFIAVHIYPGKGKVPEALARLKQFDLGKPVLVEETFPLSCGVPDEREFLLQSRGIASGWIGQYPKETPEELRALKAAGKASVPQAAYLEWLDLFRDVGPQMLGEGKTR